MIQNNLIFQDVKFAIRNNVDLVRSKILIPNLVSTNQILVCNNVYGLSIYKFQIIPNLF